MSRPGLQAFHFRVTEKTGAWFEVCFYASSARVAKEYAKRWAERLGHRSVELVGKGPA